MPFPSLAAATAHVDSYPGATPKDKLLAFYNAEDSMPPPNEWPTIDTLNDAGQYAYDNFQGTP